MTDRKPLGTVGIAQALLTMSATKAEYTTAIFKAEDVPAGAELFIHPKDSRLRLEVEVANENAQHWKGNLEKANATNRAHRLQRILMKEMLKTAAKALDNRRDYVTAAEIHKLLDELKDDQ